MGTSLLSNGASYYLALYFMRSEPQLRYLISFDSAAAPPSVTDAQVTAARHAWSDAFLYYLRKLTLRAARQGKGGGGVGGCSDMPPRLLLKSPIHTARIPVLRQLFPEAQFIYIHRDPLEVFARCSLLQSVAVCCGMSQPVEVRFSPLQSVAVCCSLL